MIDDPSQSTNRRSESLGFVGDFAGWPSMSFLWPNPTCTTSCRCGRPLPRLQRYLSPGFHLPRPRAVVRTRNADVGGHRCAGAEPAQEPLLCRHLSLGFWCG